MILQKNYMAPLSRRLMKGVYYFLFLPLIMSCRPEPLEVTNIPAVEPEIVVASQIIPDGTLLIMLTKTFGALEASGDSDPEALLRQVAVSDALVTVSGPGGVYTLFSLNNGFYGGVNIPFREGEEYTLNVESGSLGSVEATTTVLPMVKFEKIRAELYYNEFDDTLAEISYSFHEPAGPNWYMLNVQEVEIEDIVENTINPRTFTKIFEDDGIEEGVFSEQFRVYPRDYAPGDTIAVSISNISKDYYQFMQMRLDNRYNFLEFISEPINYPSNVEGGRGYFNLYIPDIRFFIFE